MKKSSTKASGLLGDLNFQQVAPVSSEVFRGCQTDVDDVNGSQMISHDVSGSQKKSEDSTGSHLMSDDVTSSQMESQVVRSGKKPDATNAKKAKKAQKPIGNGDDRQAMMETDAAKQTFKMPKKNQGIKGKGCRARMSIPMSIEVRDYISKEARKHGMTNGEFIYSLASAAASGMIKLEDFLEE